MHTAVYSESVGVTSPVEKLRISVTLPVHEVGKLRVGKWRRRRPPFSVLHFFAGRGSFFAVITRTNLLHNFFQNVVDEVEELLMIKCEY